MNNYTIGLLASTCLVLVSALVAYLSADPDVVIGASIGIVVFWLTGLIFVLLRGLLWYKSDLAERTLEEIERQEEEDIGEEELEKGMSFEFVEEE